VLLLLLSLVAAACRETSPAPQEQERAGAPAADPVPETQAHVASGPLPPLQACGQAICQAGGRRFRWRGVTAFALADLVADGNVEGARAFVNWAARSGFTVLRVLAMNHGWMSLSPEEGRRALPQVFALAREHGMYVQAVALAGTGLPQYRSDQFLREQVGAVARVCAEAGNCVLEIANEPYHSTQARLHDPDVMRRLQAEVPADLLVAWGAAREDDSEVMSGGRYVVVHLGRSGNRWNRVARMRELAALSRAVSKPVIDNEPIGAAERDARDRRDALPAAFFAQGALSRMLEVGSTFHCEDCLLARVPGPTQQRAADAFVEGSRIVPDETVVIPVDLGADGSAVASADIDHARVFTAVAGTTAWVLVLGTEDDTPIRWNTGWRPAGRQEPVPGVELWTATR
jgi:hypothetical protein